MAQVVETKKGGPYTKKEKEKRRDEVYRLHFEYGYPARKIADLMKVNRNTINGDLKYCYSVTGGTRNFLRIENTIFTNLERLEIQYTRLREDLDKSNSFSEKMSIEHMLYEIDSKIIYTNHRLAESGRRMIDFSIIRLNDWMKDHGKKEQFRSMYDLISLSPEAEKKIAEIIEEDRIKKAAKSQF